jgi:hypothetical protein
LEKELTIRREIGGRAGLIPTLHNIAYINLQKQQLQAAHETNNTEGLFNVSRDLGNVLCIIGQKKEGVRLLQVSFAVGRQIDYPGLQKVEKLVRKYR